MQIFGLTIERTKAPGALQNVDSRGAWFQLIRESYTGAWQSNIEVRLDSVLTHPTVFACITLIASDIGKLGLCLKQETADGIWEDVEPPQGAAYAPVLRKPNRYQTIGKFLEQWMISKLIYGNTYVLKERDQRGVVVALYILDPNRVRPLVADDGSVYYGLLRDTLSSLPREQVVVPAREIMQDVMYTFYHPLVGLPPLFASGLLATLGLKIVTNSSKFFANGSNPGGILTAPGTIGDETARRLKADWETNFGGDNYGKTAVLGDGLKYEPMMIPADKSQLTEQWGKTSEAIATTFHVPFHLVGGPPPPYNNIQALTVQYFTQCLQALCKQAEAVMDEGLGLGPQFGNDYGTEFDVDDLMLMDSLTRAEAAGKAVNSGLSYNESRFKYFDLGPVGRESPRQQQYYSLEALAKRDTAAPPPPTPAPQPAMPEPVPAKQMTPSAKRRHLDQRLRRTG